MNGLTFNKQLFRTAVKNKGLYMKQLPELLEKHGIQISESMLSSWTRTNDSRFPNIPKLIEIAKYLEIDYHDLIGLPKERESEPCRNQNSNSAMKISLLITKINQVDKNMKSILKKNMLLEKEIEQLKIDLKEALVGVKS